MTGKIFTTLAVFALFSLSQAAFKEDLESYLTPWINAALTTMPLVNLAVEEVMFLQRETVGLEPKVVGNIYNNAQQRLTALEAQVKSNEGKSCMGDLRNVLNTATEKFRSDGNCLRLQQLKAEGIIKPLFKVIFPFDPTPACPIPVMCKINLTSFNPRNLREALNVYKEVEKHVVELLKFIVYFKKEITACRNDPTPYHTFASSVLRIAPACVKK